MRLNHHFLKSLALLPDSRDDIVAVSARMVGDGVADTSRSGSVQHFVATAAAAGDAVRSYLPAAATSPNVRSSCAPYRSASTNCSVITAEPPSSSCGGTPS